MNVTLLDITSDAAVFMGRCAAVCYDSDGDSRDACLRRLATCLDHGHLSVLRFATATFEVSGISRACSHQLVRHPHLSFLQRSQRHCNESATGMVRPPAVPEHLHAEAIAAMREWYRQMRVVGLRKEDARYYLPQAIETELIVTGNFQAWRDFLTRRCDAAAQWEIRSIACAIRDMLAARVPEVFGR